MSLLMVHFFRPRTPVLACRGRTGFSDRERPTEGIPADGLLPQHLRRHRSSRQQRGVVLVVAIVSLLVAGTLAAVAIQTTLRAQRERKLVAQARQTELLLDAGIALAEERLTASADYVGETWDASDAFTNDKKSTVSVSVQPSSEGGAKQVQVVARIASQEDSQQATQASFRFRWAANKQTSNTENE